MTDLEPFLSIGQRLSRDWALTSPADWEAEFKLSAIRLRYPGKTWLALQRAEELEQRYRRWRGVIYA